MSDKNSKELRKQLRNVVQEIIPELLTRELCEAVYAKVRNDIMERLSGIDKQVTSTLEGINERAQNFQGFVMREMATASAQKAEQTMAEETAPKTE